MVLGTLEAFVNPSCVLEACWPAKRFLWLRGSGLFRRLIAGGGSCGFAAAVEGFGFVSSQGRRLIRRLPCKVSSDRLPRSFARCRYRRWFASFAVFVDGALALSQYVKNHSQINMAPDFRPLSAGPARFARFAEGGSRCLIVL